MRRLFTGSNENYRPANIPINRGDGKTMSFDLNAKEFRLNFDYLKESAENQLFNVVKINRSKTPNGTPTIKFFCTIVGGEFDKKTVIKEIYNTKNNIPNLRRFIVSCGKSEIRSDEDGEKYDHVLISEPEQLMDCFFRGDYIRNKNDYLELRNERQVSLDDA